MSKLDRREFLRIAGATGVALTTGSISAEAQGKPSGKSVAGLRVPRMDTVRVGFIGVGARGSGHVATMLTLEGADVRAICDTHAPAAEAAAKQCVDKGRNAPLLFTNGPKDYRRMLDRDDLDIVIISTPWADHAPMAVDAMERGKHAFIEVPAATTVDDCWRLVDTSERTQRHCMMMENVNYGREELMVLNMCRQGVFGELLHGEAAYIHDLRWQMNEIDRGTGSWRTLEYTKRNGNLYPTHGLGPVAWYMNINRGDRFDYMSSVSSPARARELFAKEHYPEGHIRRSHKFVCGDINTSIIKTALGRTILVQWDEQLPRPYNRLNLIQGTRGVWGGFPNRVVVEGEGSTERWQQGEELKKWFEKFDHPLWTRLEKEALANGGHGGMDFVMLWRIVYCLRNGLPVDQDVYDAAAWSVIGPLSEKSVARRGRSMDVPDFTRGQWKTMKPVAL